MDDDNRSRQRGPEQDPKTYEDVDQPAHFVPQNGEEPRPPAPEDPEELPAKQQPPAHKGGPRVPPTKIWDDESQAFLDSLDKDRKQANESDYHQPDGGPVTRGDQGPD